MMLSCLPHTIQLLAETDAVAVVNQGKPDDS